LRVAALLVALLVRSSTAAPSRPPNGAGAAGFQRGISLGLFAEDPGWSYRPLLDEIAQTGADHVELVVAWYLDDVHATAVHEHPRYSAPADAVARAIRDAHAAGLAVFLFPILRLERQANPDEWRGTLAPTDPGALFASYTRALVGLARLAARERVELLSVGSELSTLDGERGPWVKLVRAIRAVYPGALTYSGNWDHFRRVAFYDLLDYAGLCGYFALAPRGGGGGGGAGDGGDGKPIDTEALVASWRNLRAQLERFAADLGRPLLFTEVGYLSQRGAAAWPWNEGATEPVDLDDQRRCYHAFRRAWEAPSSRGSSALAGVYFWNWYGWGGEHSRGYTPRGKPAVDEIRAFFVGRRAIAASHNGRSP
jgi:hypothetical protein